MGLFGNMFGGMLGGRKPQGNYDPNTQWQAGQSGLASESMVAPQASGGGFNAPGGWADKLTGIGGILQDTPQEGQFLTQGITDRNNAQNAQLLQQAKTMASLQEHRNNRLFDNANQPDDEITRSIRGAGMDPASPEGKALYQQHAWTMAQHAPNLVGDPEHGYRWVSPPSMAPGQGAVGGLPQAPVGKLTPINGGQTPPASGNFRW